MLPCPPPSPYATIKHISETQLDWHNRVTNPFDGHPAPDGSSCRPFVIGRLMFCVQIIHNHQSSHLGLAQQHQWNENYPKQALIVKYIGADLYERRMGWAVKTGRERERLKRGLADTVSWLWAMSVREVWDGDLVSVRVEHTILI